MIKNQRHLQVSMVLIMVTLSLSSLISNLTQGCVYTITQTGSHSNSFKDSSLTNIAISNTLSVSGNSSLTSLSLGGNLTQSSSNITTQSGSSTNQLKSTQINGTLTCDGNISMASGSAALRAITHAAGFLITQSGMGTNSANSNTLRNISRANGHVISQTGTNRNEMKGTNFSASISIAGAITQTSGSSTLRNISCNNITQSSNCSIIQSGVTSNALGSTTISELIASSSMSFPGSVTIPSATISDDFTITGDGRILQDQTSLTVNILKSTNIKSLEVEESITQNSGAVTLCDVVCDSLNTKEFNLLDSGGRIFVSDAEMRFLAGATSSIQAQLNSIVATDTDLQTDVTNLQTDVTNLQTDLTALQTNLDDISNHVTTTVQDQIDSIILVNSTQTDDIADLQEQMDDLEINHNDHVANAVLLTTDQSIAGSKSFTSTLTTNGIENSGWIKTETLSVNDILQIGNEGIFHGTKPVVSSSLSVSAETVGVLVGQVSIPAQCSRNVCFNIPVNLYSEVVAPISTTRIQVSDTITSITYGFLDKSSVTVLSGTAVYNRTLPLVYTYDVTPLSLGSFPVRLQSGTAFVRTTLPLVNVDKTYRLFLTVAGALIHDGGGVIGASRSYEFNSSLFPISSPSVNEGTYYKFSSSLKINSFAANMPTSFTPGLVSITETFSFSNNEITCGDIVCRSLRIST
ncbi:MAG: hypothetical protein EOP48_05525 [Sphingobacteriales bacterium]|nr:MAG: hypothetical protein EOP48_05525 [Sphingobacteriales bacterium]